MMVIKTCSLTENGPGLRDTPSIFTLGTAHAHRRPRGKDSSCATICQGSMSFDLATDIEVMSTTYASDGHRRITEEEELIHTGQKDGPYDSYRPSTDGIHRHVYIVRVGDCRAHLRVWRVIVFKFPPLS